MAQRREERFLMRQRGAGRQLQDDDFGISLFGAAKSPAPEESQVTVSPKPLNTAVPQALLSPPRTQTSIRAASEGPREGEGSRTGTSGDGIAAKQSGQSSTLALGTPASTAPSSSQPGSSAQRIVSSGKKRKKRKSIGQQSMYKKKRLRLSQERGREETSDQPSDSQSLGADFLQFPAGEAVEYVPAVMETVTETLEPELMPEHEDEARLPRPQSVEGDLFDPKGKAKVRPKARKLTDRSQRNTSIENAPTTVSPQQSATPTEGPDIRLHHANMFAPLGEAPTPKPKGGLETANESFKLPASINLETPDDPRDDMDNASDEMPADASGEPGIETAASQPPSPRTDVRAEEIIADDSEMSEDGRLDGMERSTSQSKEDERSSTRSRRKIIHQADVEDEVEMHTGNEQENQTSTDKQTLEEDRAQARGKAPKKRGRRPKQPAPPEADLSNSEIEPPEDAHDTHQPSRERVRPPRLQSSRASAPSHPVRKHKQHQKRSRADIAAKIATPRQKANTVAFHTYVPNTSDFPPGADEDIGSIIPPLLTKESSKPTPTAPDVLAHLSSEVVQLALSKINEDDAEDKAERAAAKRRHDAVKSFGEELVGRLQDISRLLSVNSVMERRMKHCKKAKKELWSEFVESKSKREDAELGLFHIRGRQELALKVRHEDETIIKLIEGTQRARGRGSQAGGTKVKKIEDKTFILKKWSRLPQDGRRKTDLMDRIRTLNGILQEVIDE